MREPVYEVFARKNREDPLHHIGYINAMDDQLARVYAWNTYDEQNWFEMCVVPRSAILPVNRPDEPFPTWVPEGTGAVVHAIGAASYGGEDIADEEVDG